MSKRNADVDYLLDIIEQIEHAYAAQVNVKTKYSFVFFNLLPKLNAGGDEANIIFSWVDPDGTYDEDLDAFIAAIREFRDELDKLAL